MNTKKSFIIGILSIFVSIVCIVFYSYYGLVFFIVKGLADKSENTNNNFVLTIILILTAVLLILFLTNIVLSCISFKYTRRKGEKFSAGRKFMKAFAIILLITAVLNIVSALLQFGAVIFMALSIIIALIYIMFAVFILSDIKKYNNYLINK